MCTWSAGILTASLEMDQLVVLLFLSRFSFRMWLSFSLGGLEARFYQMGGSSSVGLGIWIGLKKSKYRIRSSLDFKVMSWLLLVDQNFHISYGNLIRTILLGSFSNSTRSDLSILTLKLSSSSPAPLHPSSPPLKLSPSPPVSKLLPAALILLSVVIIKSWEPVQSPSPAPDAEKRRSDSTSKSPLSCLDTPPPPALWSGAPRFWNPQRGGESGQLLQMWKERSSLWEAGSSWSITRIASRACNELCSRLSRSWGSSRRCCWRKGK